MNIEGFDLEDEHIQTFYRTLNKLQQKYTVDVIDCDKIPKLFEWIDELKSFEILSHYNDFDIINSFQISVREIDFKIINMYVSYALHVGKGQVVQAGDIQNMGWVELPVDFGHVLITQETFADKAIDFFLRRDVDFEEHNEFSSKFLVLCSDKETVKRYFTRGFLEAITKLKSIQIEIKGNKLIAKYQKTMTMTDTMAIARMVEKIKRNIRSSF